MSSSARNRPSGQRAASVMRMSSPSPVHVGTMSTVPSPRRSRAPAITPPRSLAAASTPSVQVASGEFEKLSSSRLMALTLSS
jgi:hypothetical protein